MTIPEKEIVTDIESAVSRSKQSWRVTATRAIYREARERKLFI